MKKELDKEVEELKNNEIKETKEKEVEKEVEKEDYPELSFLKVFVYSSIPYWHIFKFVPFLSFGIPLKFIALRDVRNGKEPFYGAKNPLTKFFAYLVTLEFSGSLFLIQNVIGAEKIVNFFDRIDDTVASIGRGLKKVWDKVLGLEKEELVEKLEKEEPVEKLEKEESVEKEKTVYNLENLEIPREVKTKLKRNYSLSGVDRLIDNEINSEKVKEKLQLSPEVRIKLERINKQNDKLELNDRRSFANA